MKLLTAYTLYISLPVEHYREIYPVVINFLCYLSHFGYVVSNGTNFAQGAADPDVGR